MSIQSPVYCQRDSVKRALDIAATAREDTQIDRLIQAAARRIDKACNRVFYPTVATRKFDWPTNYNGSGGRPWQIWLDANELISVSSITSGSVSIPTNDVNLEPVNYGPPFTRIEIDLASASSFSGALTWQQGVAITGLYGHSNDEVSAGLSIASLTSSQTAVTISDASVLSPGALIRLDAERMLVSDAAMATTGVTFAGALTASAADVLLDVGGAAATFAVSETILLDGERMLIVDISGPKLVVKRAWDGSVLATHTNTSISAARLLTVTRGFLGTTAATHAINAPISRHTPPALVEQTNVGLTLYALSSEQGGISAAPLSTRGGDRKRSSAEKRSPDPVTAMMEALVDAYGRRARTRAV